MDKFLRISAYLANVLMILAVLIIWQDNRPHGAEVLLMALLFFPPILSLLAIWQGPDREERRLRRAVNKAELKKRLKELGEG
jgi:hypothetical protein